MAASLWFSCFVIAWLHCTATASESLSGKLAVGDHTPEFVRGTLREQDVAILQCEETAAAQRLAKKAVQDYDFLTFSKDQRSSVRSQPSGTFQSLAHRLVGKVSREASAALRKKGGAVADVLPPGAESRTGEEVVKTAVRAQMSKMVSAAIGADAAHLHATAAPSTTHPLVKALGRAVHSAHAHPITRRPASRDGSLRRLEAKHLAGANVAAGFRYSPVFHLGCHARKRTDSSRHVLHATE